MLEFICINHGSMYQSTYSVMLGQNSLFLGIIIGSIKRCHGQGHNLAPITSKSELPRTLEIVDWDWVAKHDTIRNIVSDRV